MCALFTYTFIENKHEEILPKNTMYDNVNKGWYGDVDKK